MLTISKDNVHRALSREIPPAAWCESGERVRFITMDAMGDQFVDANNPIIDESKAGNPSTGPLYVKGAEPGDMLKVTVEAIDLPNIMSMTTAPGAGVFGDEIPELKRKLYSVENGLVHFNDKLSFPVRPMLGVIGVAPMEGIIETSYPGEHGGNMDCKEIIQGSVLYLPVFCPGGLLFVGDVHALMGDGEVCICGAETAAQVVLKVELVKKSYGGLVLLNEDKVMTIATAPTLDQASVQATKAMRRLLEKELGMEFHESCRVLSLVGDVRICQVVDPLMTCRMEVPMSLFRTYGYSFA